MGEDAPSVRTKIGPVDPRRLADPRFSKWFPILQLSPLHLDNHGKLLDTKDPLWAYENTDTRFTDPCIGH